MTPRPIEIRFRWAAAKILESNHGPDSRFHVCDRDDYKLGHNPGLRSQISEVSSQEGRHKPTGIHQVMDQDSFRTDT